MFVPLSQQILRTDISGMPLEWIDFQEAVRLHYTDKIAYTSGSDCLRVRGGYNSATGRRTVLVLNSIISTRGHNRRLHETYAPPLNNQTLFKRDGWLCLYCGEEFARAALSRDHVRPLSQGGADEWNNVVTACKRCNNQKAGRTPEAAGMCLLAIPFAPTHAEYVYLQGRRVLADQMEFLRAHFPRTSPLHEHQHGRLGPRP